MVENSRKLLVKMAPEDGGTKVPVGGVNTRTISINNNLQDVTTSDFANPDDPIWQNMVYGVKSLNVSGNGFFVNRTQTARIIAANENDAYLDLDIVVPKLGTFTGSFAVGDVEIGGELQGGVTMSLTFQSDGAVTFTGEGATTT